MTFGQDLQVFKISKEKNLLSNFISICDGLFLTPQFVGFGRGRSLCFFSELILWRKLLNQKNLKKNV